MADTITFTLREGRTKRKLFEDAAIANGWSETVTTTQTFSHTVTYDELVKYGTAKRVLEAANIPYTKVTGVDNGFDGNTVITYTVETTGPNPVSAVEFGKVVVTRAIDLYDAENQAAALKRVTEELVKSSDGKRLA